MKEAGSSLASFIVAVKEFYFDLIMMGFSTDWPILGMDQQNSQRRAGEKDTESLEIKFLNSFLLQNTFISD